jgi:hypothetical protein
MMNTEVFCFTSQAAVSLRRPPSDLYIPGMLRMTNVNSGMPWSPMDLADPYELRGGRGSDSALGCAQGN